MFHAENKLYGEIVSRVFNRAIRFGRRYRFSCYVHFHLKISERPLSSIRNLMFGYGICEF